MSLSTKYRPKDWDSVIGQEYTTTILRNALILNRVGHAYLFHGSRGTGKTTSARILAKAVNCLNLQNGNPCHSCTNCKAFDDERLLDIVEIDAASNTGVDNIRDLIDKARFEPNQGKYKVYIIDEVHMLSAGAFNALLKTLELPPPHVKFILATTDIDKVLETVRSRTQRFDFRKITDADIIGRLEYICGMEHIQADPKALSLIARSARGGMRDAITLLEQNLVDQNISYEHLTATLMWVDEERLDKTIESLITGDKESLLMEIQSLRSIHVSARSYLEQMLYRLRDLLFERLDTSDYSALESIFAIMLDAHGKLRSFPDGLMLIEVTLLRALMIHDSSKIIPPASGKKVLPKDESIVSGISPQIQPVEKLTTPSGPGKKMEEKGISEVSSSPLPQEKEAPTVFSFSELLHKVKTAKPALVADLKNARFEIKDNTITFIFPSSWNYERVNTVQIKNMLAGCLASLFGGEWSIGCKLETGGGGTRALKEVAESIF